MAEELAIEILSREGECEIIIKGVVDESAGPLFDSVSRRISGTVRLNMAGVSRINSFGIGVLMRFLSRVSAQHEVLFENCSEAMVDQFQMLEFSIYGRIKSFYILYYCERCEREERSLIDIARDIRVDSGSPQLELRRCRCGGLLAPEDSVEFVQDHM
jgi:anti-anti-sigma regulatory factor